MLVSLGMGLASLLAASSALSCWHRWRRRQEAALIVNAIRSAWSEELSLLLIERTDFKSAVEVAGDPALIVAVKSLTDGRCGMCAALNTVRLLLSHGADVNESGAEWKTALMHAAAGGCEELCEMLLSRGADPSAHDMFGRTAADWAESGGHHALAGALRTR